MTPTHHAAEQGTVVTFDGHRGLGVVEDRTGTRYDFHCTAIEGSRTIAGGTRVLFNVVPGHLGRVEATTLRPLMRR
ncbi:MAG: cold-shock protein [Acidimicrobiia bacterium]